MGSPADDRVVDKQGDLSKLLSQSQAGTETLNQVRAMLGSLRVSHIASLLESSQPKIRRIIWELIPLQQEGEVLQLIRDDLRSALLQEMEIDEVATVIGSMETDDIADILQKLPATVTQEVLNMMSEQDRARVKRVLDYPDDTAGGLMNTDIITVRPSMQIDAVLRYLRWRADLPADIDCLMVVSRRDRFLGLLPVNRLLAALPSLSVRELMDTERQPIHAATPAAEVAALFERNDWVSAPVVDDEGILLGRITVDDVVDVIRGQANRSLMNRFGLSAEEDTFAPLSRAAPGRVLWLGVNLLTAFIAAATIHLFEETLAKVIALAVLMPIVASMGGIAGSQVLTIIERGVARGNINSGNISWLFSRELLIGLLNGLLWALVVAPIAYWWFGDALIGWLIAAALLINLLVGAMTGLLLPVLMRSVGMDPAVGGGVIVTTVTDVVGFATFLGLATIAYS